MNLLDTVRDRLNGWQSRLVRKPEFQRWAARFPLTRPVARRQAERLFDVINGFIYSQTLAACIELEVLERAEQQPLGLNDFETDGLTEDAAARLLGAAAALELLHRTGNGHFALGPLGAALLGNPSLKSMITHHAVLYRDLLDPVALLRKGEGALKQFWGYAKSDDPASLSADRAAEYSRLMADTQTMVAETVLNAYGMDGRRHLLDIGGGEGIFARTAARRHPELEITVFDLPAVAQRAQAAFVAEGLADRCRAVGGDMFAGKLPSGADTISLVRILHDHDDDSVMALLRDLHPLLPFDGVLLIAEPMAGPAPGARTVGDVYFAFYLLSMGQGRARTVDELCAMAEKAGFSSARSVATDMPLLTRLIVARR